MFRNKLLIVCVFFAAIMQCMPVTAGKNKKAIKNSRLLKNNQSSKPSKTQPAADVLASNGEFKITSYGAVPDSNSDSAPAFKKAIKKAQEYVSTTGLSAEIVVPTGSYYISQFTFDGLNNISVHLEQDTIIKAFPKYSTVNASKPYLTIQNSNTFAFYGDEGSVIDGNGATWWSGSGERPDFISFEKCKNYELYGLSVINSPNHTIRLSDCKKGKIHDLVIEAPQNSPSTDGIDPMSNVDDLEIYNCQISNGDDCIAINANSGPMNNIHIHDCVLRNGHGLSFGSAINYDITNVLVENITIEGTQYGIRFKFAYSDKKANVSNISFNNIKASDLSRDAIRITTEYSSQPNKKVTLQDISFNDFACVGASKGLNFTVTNEKQVLTPIVLNNVSITDTQHKDTIHNCPIIVDGNPE